MRIELVIASPERSELRSLELPDGATAAEAIAASGLVGIDPETVPLGVYARRISASTRLADGDRLEIYRPLVSDPKDARRRRASR